MPKEPKEKQEKIEDLATPEEATLEDQEVVEESVQNEPQSEAPQEMPAEELKSETEEAKDQASQPQIEEVESTVTVQPLKFVSFEDQGRMQGEINKNLDILMDVKLQLTVELGRTELPIKKVLELTRGSIIELEKVAGEPVELYANGKLVAHGEVVVIEDNFGLRITSITEPEDRLKGV